MKTLILLLCIFIITKALSNDQSDKLRIGISHILETYPQEENKKACLEAILNNSTKIKDASTLEMSKEKKQELIKENTAFHYNYSGGSVHGNYLHKRALVYYIEDENKLLEFGPGLYIAKDPFSSINFGNQLYSIKLNQKYKIFDANKQKEISNVFNTLKERDSKFSSCMLIPFLRKLLTYTIVLDNDFKIAMYTPYKTGWFIILDTNIINSLEINSFHERQYTREEEVLTYTSENFSKFTDEYLNSVDIHRRCRILKRVKDQNPIITNLKEKYCVSK